MKKQQWWLMLVHAAWFGAAALAAEIRYGDAFYFDEWNLPPLQLKALGRTPLCFSRDRSNVIAHIAKGQPATVLGWSETNYYVVVQIATGPARGWVEADAFEKPAADVIEKLKARRERVLANRELIARHEVALGMAREEVLASIGKPDRKSQVRSKEGDQEEWLYFTYRYVPRYSYLLDQYGQLKPYVTYQKIVTGHKAVSFRGGEVIAVADEAGDNPVPAGALVTPPLPNVVY